MIQDALRARPDAARLRKQVLTEIQPSSNLGPAPSEAVLSDSEKYLQFLMGNLEYAIFPHARIPVFAMSFGTKNRDMARQWTTGQIKKDIADETWTQAPNLSKIADIFARAVVFIGKCRFPLYLSKSEAGDWFIIWRMLNEHPCGI